MNCLNDLEFLDEVSTENLDNFSVKKLIYQSQKGIGRKVSASLV